MKHLFDNRNLRRFPHRWPVRLARPAVVSIALAVCGTLLAQSVTPTPPWFPPVYRQMLRAPLPAQLQYATGTIPSVFPVNQTDVDPSGLIGTYNVAGPTVTANNAFFQSLGTNGRACITCHQPAASMTLSLTNIRSRFISTLAKDPLFAPVDGANCPDAVPPAMTSPSPSGGFLGLGQGIITVASMFLPNNPYSELLNRGLIRIPLPWPPKDSNGNPITPEFTLKVVKDPTRCEINPRYGLTSPEPAVSVYRRPLMSTNLDFVTTVLNFGQGTDPFTGKPLSGNIMFDGREPTLHSQAIDATLGHAQATTPPTAAQVQQMVDFENAVFSAQIYDNKARSLTAAGALGGPVNLQGQTPGVFGIPESITEYEAWRTATDTNRLSILRGQDVFNRKTFTVANVAGFNDFPGVTNPLPGATCSTCHNVAHDGADILPAAQRDLGVAGNHAAAIPAPDLPLFELTCTGGKTTLDGSTTVRLRDPGVALLTGKCIDIGKFKVPQLRGLAAHAPYFQDGSAAALEDVVNFYDRRFGVGFTAQEKQDLVNFLKAL